MGFVCINKKNNKPRAKSELTFIKKLAFFYKNYAKICRIA